MPGNVEMILREAECTGMRWFPESLALAKDLAVANPMETCCRRTGGYILRAPLHLSFFSLIGYQSEDLFFGINADESV